MIYNCIPYSLEKNLGKEYNRYMSLLPSDDDFACFIDHDAMFTCVDWYNQLNEIVQQHPNCGCFTGMTNRIGCKWQRAPGVDQENHDMIYHRKIGQERQRKYRTSVFDASFKEPLRELSGVVILLRKSTWKSINGFKEDAILGIDTDLHRRLVANDEQILLMKGVYLYHWYRGDKKGKRHLLK